MSIEPRAGKGEADRIEERHYNVDKSATASHRVINKIDITALQIDESFGEDCDPYNSTGQHLVDAIKQKENEE